MNTIPCLFVFTGCRVYQEIIKSRFNSVIPIRHCHDPDNEDGNKFILFFEYVGNNIRTLDTIDSLLGNLSDKNIMIVIDDSYEGLTSPAFLIRFQEILDKNSNVKDWVLLSSNKLVKNTVFELFGTEENFLYFNIHLYMPEYDHVIPAHMEKNINTQLRKKKFLCVNRQERKHRLLTIDFLAKNDILKHTYASCVLGDYAPILYNNLHFKSQNPLVEQYQDSSLHKTELSKDSRERLKKILPLDIDIKEHQNKVFATNMPDLSNFFRESYFSIITEGDFESVIPKKQFTEKILKSVANHHPFIVVGLPGTLQLLREQGFITFSKFIDESYDSEENNEKRLEMALDQIKKINSLNMHQIHDLYEEMFPILEHNYNTYLNIYNTNQPTQLINRIIDWFYGDMV
jgi:hypothetical protein